MAARPISYTTGRPNMYPPQPQPQPLYHPQHQQQQQHMAHQRPIQQQQYISQQQHRPVYSTPQHQHQQQFMPAHMQQQFQQQQAAAAAMSPRPQQYILQRPTLMPAPSLPSMPIPQQQIQHRPGAPPPFNPNPNIHPGQVVGHPPGAVVPGGGGQPFVLRTPSLGAAPSVSLAGAPPGAMVNPGFRPVMMRPPGAAYSTGPPTVISSPGLARMPVAIAPGGMRPVFIAAGPPSIIKNPLRTKALLERTVPVINIKQKTNTLLSNFWGDDMDIAKDGRIIDRSTESPNGSEKKQRSRQTGIVVGIDFGNTFTGVSYAHQGDGEMIDVVKWPRHLNAYAKVPTVSLYKTNENKGMADWGSSALASYKRSKTDRILVRDYKLLLFDQNARGRLDNGLHLTDVLTQYLGSIHRHLMEEVNKSQVLAAESVPIHYCITVPQAWTLPTRELILRCYVEAGIILQTPAPNMTVITEAEAAATYCRENCEEFDSLKDGEIFMICDAGGLTTNVTVFRVDDALGVRQFVRMSSSHAENCGSVMLDRKFRELILSKLAGLDIDAKPQRQKAFETLLEGFGEIKSQFDFTSSDEVKHISVPMGLDVKELQPVPEWLEDEYMALTGQELCAVVFDPEVEKVMELIDKESKNHPVCAGLFMVGGFGANKYLLDKLVSSTNKNMANGGGMDSKRSSVVNGLAGSMSDMSLNGSVNGHASPGVIKKVVMVKKAELAVARGAVIYGLKSASQHTKAFL
ncbi:hypothetical protein BGZ96_005500 [Linnemannia gamsii]|uniref:Actin-like ATPase domain-containing protein n=1 Tax=Linnemannia gamsii TaxID=64522 RepID=A0ABQ7K4P7_9FUNG|nr:hypothetical protein BGZ96_005500 [Linnemannia gamsii]